MEKKERDGEIPQFYPEDELRTEGENTWLESQKPSSENFTVRSITSQGHSQREFIAKHALFRLSRRQLLSISLGACGVLALGVSGGMLWNYLRSPSLIQLMDGSTAAICWSPNNRRLAAGDNKGRVTVWTIDAHEIYSVQDNTFFDPIASIGWSPDGKYLAIGTENSLHIRDAQSGKLSLVYNNPTDTAGNPNCVVAWSPNSRYVASSIDRFGKVQIWEPANGRTLCTIQTSQNNAGHEPVQGIAWSPDSTSIVTAGPQIGEVAAVWGVTTGTAIVLPVPFSSQNPVNNDLDRMSAIGWSPDGTHIAVGYPDTTIAGDPRGVVVLLSWKAQTKTWEYITSIIAHTLTVYHLAWSPDSTRFATVGLDNNLQIWNASTGEHIKTYNVPSRFESGENYYLQTVAWSPDGKYLLTGDTKGQALLWEVN